MPDTVSLCNVAVSGATAASVREHQLATALEHRPDRASLVVGVNDTMRSTWEPVPELFARQFWSVDRLHPSELGHRALARAYADQLIAQGLDFEPPHSSPPAASTRPGDVTCRGWWRRGRPWFGRRARDLGPWAVRLAWSDARRSRQPTAL